MLRWPVPREQFGERVQDILAVELPLDENGPALSGVLVDHREHAQGTPVMGTVLDEVKGPDVVATARTQTGTTLVVEPQPSCPSFRSACTNAAIPARRKQV